ncbi:multidrug efflux system outer membrane protein [Robbsia andropogonis]|uniref:efflux transporter outer membrane subunit n=1 Tax=Robbsia andropogonis TaxID=28092 RepID=UPI000AF0A346|nr:efflux transporter outer membrane subunit [Robbsia andropogonis]
MKKQQSWAGQSAVDARAGRASRGARRWPASVVSVLAVAVLAACNLTPKYHRPAAPVPSGYPTGETYDTQPTSQSATQVPAADLGWNEFFTDPQLKVLIGMALKNNRDLRVAALNVAAAREQYRVERASLFPTLSATGSGTRTRTPADLTYVRQPTVSSTYQALGSAQWELDFFGRIRSLSNASLQTYFATAQARKATEISLISQVAVQYLTVRAYDAQLAVTQNTLKTAGESYRISKLQFDNGVGSALDLKQSEGVVDQAQANLQSQMRSKAQALNQLQLLVGAPLPTDLPDPLPLDKQGIIADIPAGLPSDLLTRRPDIVEAENKLLSENANIGAARAAFFPQISLTGSAGAASASLGRLLKPGQAYWSWGPQISLPIFSGGENRANLRYSEAEKNIAVANYEKAIQTAFQEVSDGLAARGTYDQQIDALQRYVASQQTRLDLSNLRYKSGTDSYLDVLTAQTDLYTAQQTLVSAQQARETNLVQLYQYLGGGWLAHTGDTPRDADVDPDWGVDRYGNPLKQADAKQGQPNAK